MPTVPTGTLSINTGNSLATGLVYCCIPGSANGLADICGNAPNLVMQTGASIATGSMGPGLKSQGTAGGAQVTINGTTSRLIPGAGQGFSYAVAVDQLGTVTPGNSVFGLLYTATDNAPYEFYSVKSSGGNYYEIAWGDGTGSGPWHSRDNSFFPTGGTHTYAGSLTVDRQGDNAQQLYQDGNYLPVTDGGPWGGSGPAFAPAPLLFMNGCTSDGGSSNMLTFIGCIWNRRLSDAEQASFAANPFQVVSTGAAAPPQNPSLPAWSHIVVLVEENHTSGEVLGSGNAPYLDSIVAGGALLTNYFAITHPSEPNYFALYAGSTEGIADDGTYNYTGQATLATRLAAAGKSFVGYVESGSPRKHNPWESFGDNVEQDFASRFPGNFANLPPVSWVIPNLNDDMHDGSVQQGDTWARNNVNAYAQWAKANNSLLIVTWDEDDSGGNNSVACIFYGAGIVPGKYSTRLNHYDLLALMCNAFGVTPPANAAGAGAFPSAMFTAITSASPQAGTGTALTAGLTARSWAASGVTPATVLSALDGMLNFWAGQVSGSGQINAVLDGNPGTDVGSAHFAYAAFYRASLGNTTWVAAGIRAMNYAAGQYSTNATGGNNFSSPSLAKAYHYAQVSGAASSGQLSTWAGQIGQIWDSQFPYSNWGCYAMNGAWLLNKYLGVTSARSGGSWNSYIDNNWNSWQAAAENSGSLGLYADSNESTVTPASMSVEYAGRSELTEMALDGYAGATASTIFNVVQQGALTSLKLVDSLGQVPPGGRTSDHVWVEMGCAATAMAWASYYAGSNLPLAGQFKRMGCLSFQSCMGYARGDGSFNVTKNGFPPASRIGYQNASFFVSYGCNLMQLTTELHKYISLSTAVAEAPFPNEMGGVSLNLAGLGHASENALFSDIFLNAGGTQVVIDTNAPNNAGYHGQQWDALGVTRLTRPGWDPKLGPSDGYRADGTFGGVTFCPAWTTGTWTDIGNQPGTDGGGYAVAFSADLTTPALVKATLTWTGSGPSFTQHLTVTPDGVLSRLTSSAAAGSFGHTLPVFQNDGGSVSATQSAASRIASATIGTNSQNYLAINTGSAFTNQGTIPTSFGNVTSYRAVSSAAEQDVFVYPAASGDPTAASVLASFVLNANGYTSNLGWVNGSLYSGRTAAGGFGSSIALSGSGTLDAQFTAPCNFMFTILNGVIQSCVTDATVGVQVGSYTYNLTANVPFKFTTPTTGGIGSAAVNESADKTDIKTVGPQITDAAGNTYSLGAATQSLLMQPLTGQPVVINTPNTVVVQSTYPMTLANILFGFDPIATAGAAITLPGGSLSQGGLLLQVPMTFSFPGNPHYFYAYDSSNGLLSNVITFDVLAAGTSSVTTPATLQTIPGATSQVLVNAVADTTTANAVELYYVNHQPYYKNASDVWRVKLTASAAWTVYAGIPSGLATPNVLTLSSVATLNTGQASVRVMNAAQPVVLNNLLMSDTVSATPTFNALPSGTTLSSNGLTVTVPETIAVAGSYTCQFKDVSVTPNLLSNAVNYTVQAPPHVITVRDHNHPTFQAVSGAFVVSLPSAIEALTVATPSGATTGTALVLSGTYVNVTPAALDYSTDGSTFFAITGIAIAGGTWSGTGPTFASAQGGIVITVRDHTNTTIKASTAAFAVTVPASGPTPIPLRLTNMGSTASVRGQVTHAHAFADGFIPPGGSAVLTDSAGHVVTSYQQEAQASWPSGSPSSLVMRYVMAETLAAGAFVSYTITPSATAPNATPATAWGTNPLTTLAANSNITTRFYGSDAGGTQAAPGYSISVNDIIANNRAWGVPAPPIAQPPPGTIIGGSGPDTLTLQMTEDAYQGDAQFSMSIDGTQIGGTQTVTTLRSSGNSQPFSIRGSFSTGTHTATIAFLNDAYGGTAATDRNVYIKSATINGIAIPNSTIEMLAPDERPNSFTFTAATISQPVGQWELIGSGPVAMSWRFERYLKNAAGGNHAYVKAVLYVTAWSPTGPFEVTGMLYSPITLTPLAGGDGAAAAAKRFVCIMETYNGTTLIGAAGGPNDPVCLAGKNVWQPSWFTANSDIISQTFAATAGSSAISGMFAGRGVSLSSTGTLPGNLASGTVYWVADAGGNATSHNWQLATSRAMAARIANVPGAPASSSYPAWSSGAQHVVGAATGYCSVKGIRYVLSGTTSGTTTGKSAG